METINQQHEIAAVFIARIVLGLLFFFQGYDSVFNIRIRNVLETYQDSFSDKGIPKFFTAAGVIFTSFTELICGFLLIIGLYEYSALYLLGINLIIASAAFSINTPMWDMRHVFPRLLLLLFLLAVPHAWNAWSFDNLLINYKN